MILLCEILAWGQEAWYNSRQYKNDPQPMNIVSKTDVLSWLFQYKKTVDSTAVQWVLFSN